MTPHIKIIILNWNKKDLLKLCLDSILKINYSNYSVLVIDNDSSDKSVKMVVKEFPSIDILKLDKNYGFSKAYNICFKKIKNELSEFIMILNNDTQVDSDILNSFNNARIRYGDDHIYGAKIYFQKNRKLIWYAGGKVNLKWGYISHRGIRKMDSSYYSYPMQTDYVTGCCQFTSFKVINQLNGFDELFNMYGEDVDLCLRAKAEGINCYYWPDAKLWHYVSASLGGHMKLIKIYKKYKSLIRLWKKYHLDNYLKKY